MPTHTGNHDESPETVVRRHAEAIQRADVALLLSDYAPDAVIIASFGVFSNHTEIKELFEDFFANDKEAAYKTFTASFATLKSDVIAQEGTFCAHSPKEWTGHDIFVVRNGKIVFQTAGLIVQRR